MFGVPQADNIRSLPRIAPGAWPAGVKPAASAAIAQARAAISAV